MKKILALVLVLMMTVPLFAFSVSAEGTPAEIYAAAKDGDLLQTVNFKGEDWTQEFKSDSYKDGSVAVSDDGTTATITLANTNNRRVAWGSVDEDVRFPVDEDNSKYTLLFDLKFSKTNGQVRFGIRLGDDQALVIDGNGHTYWYNWGSVKTGASSSDDERWNYVTDVAKADTHTFAVEIDYTEGTMTLFVKNSDGTFGYVREVTHSDYEKMADGTGLTCQLFACPDKNSRDVSGDGHYATVSNLQVFKGLAAGGHAITTTGAAVRMDNPTGIRFNGQFRKTLIDGLKTTYGEDKVKIGMLIVPTDYLEDNDVEFTISALEACNDITAPKYVKIDAERILDDGYFYSVNCALAPVNEGNYDRSFSARAYVEVNGEIYAYSDFDLTDNSRSVADVAYDAYHDFIDPSEKEADEDTYVNEVTIIIDGEEVTKYSRYTQTQLDTLYGFFGQREQ